MVEVVTYRAVYQREPDRRWTVRIPDVPGCHSYGRTIAQARARIREALGLFVDDADTAEINDDIQLPKSVSRQIRIARQLREKVTREQREMIVAQRKAVAAIRKLELGHRDAGHLLGVSFQRAHQIEELPEMPGAVIERHKHAAHSRHLVKRAAKKR